MSKFPVKIYTEDCTECDGTGSRTSGICRNCNGDGVCKVSMKTSGKKKSNRSNESNSSSSSSEATSAAVARAVKSGGKSSSSGNKNSKRQI